MKDAGDLSFEPAREGGHGVVGWADADACPTLPENLPDGRPWPCLRVLVHACEAAPDLAATLASVAGQHYPPTRLETVLAGPDGEAFEAALGDPGTDYLLLLRAGDLLAPGALATLGLEAALSGAGAVAGMRVLFDRGVHGLDILLDIIADPGASAQDASFTGGEILLARRAVVAAGGFDPDAVRPVAALWPRLLAAGVRIARIARPVLLQRDPGGAPEETSGLSIVSLTDLGDRGGAGIAQRRLAEALGLSGHRLTHLRLCDESPPATAEWTERFPRTERAILDGGHDLVLAGNLHGATRGGGLPGRLAAALPVGIVLHDLFALTGRCAHPKDCPVIATGCDARCPTPSLYPQLAPDRIAAAFADKRAALAAPRAPLLFANSAWTESRARDLAPPGAGIARVTLAFPTGVFRPRDRVALRRELGLPERDVLVLFAAVIADAPEKGFDDLLATIARVARPGIGFVAVGRIDDPRLRQVPGLHAPGPIGDEDVLAQWYAACDIYLTASRLETLGQTAIEAGLCGVPALAYRATGLTSAVIDGVTGVLVEPREDALAEALEALIADEPRRRRLGAFARIVLESRFSHAAAALSLHEALAGWGATRIGACERLRFAPAMLGQFAFARDRQPGASGLVAPPAGPLVRAVRRLKLAAFGRGMPIWLRQVAYAAARLRAGGLRRSPSP